MREPTGLNLAYVQQAWYAMQSVFGSALTDPVERTYVFLAALDGVPEGVEADAVVLPAKAAAVCYYSAYAAALDIRDGEFWQRRRRRRQSR